MLQRILQSHRFFAAALLVVALPCCATVSSENLRTDRTVLSSVETVSRTAGEVRLRRAEWQGERLVADVERVQLCQKQRLSEVSYQNVLERQTSRVPLAILGGSALAGGGGALAWMLDSKEAPASGSGVDGANAGKYALVAAICGAAWLGNGIVTGLRGIDRAQGGPRIEREAEDLSPLSACGLVRFAPLRLPRAARVAARAAVRRRR